MKKILFTSLLSMSVFAYSQFSIPAASPHQKIEQQFSISKITIDYARPGVKGRKIFGELVPYGKVWRAGANSATKITFEQSINFGGKVVPAGTYGLFVIPTEKDWTIILNKDAQQWGAFDFNEKLNVLQVTVPVQKLNEKQEWFEISLNPKDDHSQILTFKWDDVKAEVLLSEGNPETAAKIIDKLKEIKSIQAQASKK